MPLVIALVVLPTAPKRVSTTALGPPVLRLLAEVQIPAGFVTVPHLAHHPAGRHDRRAGGLPGCRAAGLPEKHTSDARTMSRNRLFASHSLRLKLLAAEPSARWRSFGDL